MLARAAVPAQAYKEHLEGHGPRLALPWNEASPVGVTQPCSIRQITSGNLNDFDSPSSARTSSRRSSSWTTLVLTGARRCLRLPLRPVQHRRPGPVLRRRVLRGLDRLVVRRADDSFVHITLAIVAAALAGALWAGIAGILKATVGAHEVITTIMLNWIAYLRGRSTSSARAAHCRTASKPARPDVERRRGEREAAGLLGDPAAARPAHRPLHRPRGARRRSGFIINRTTLGYEVRAVGFNPEAAAYGGISVKRNYFLAMAISGVFAGLAGAMDMLGWRSSIGFSDIQSYSYDRVPRHRRRAARPQHRGRHLLRRARSLQRCSTAPRRATSRPRSSTAPSRPATSRR